MNDTTRQPSPAPRIVCQWCQGQNLPGTVACHACGAPLDVRNTVSDSSRTPAPRPREPNARARRRAWAEPRVRFWLLAASVLLIVGLAFVIQGIRARFHDAWLIQNGVKIDALIKVANNEPVKNKQEPPTSIVELQFPWKGDPKYAPRPRPLEGRKTGDFITVNSILPIHVNPDDPQDWTWRNEPVPMLERMIGGIVVIPLALLTMLWSLLQHRMVLKIWRDGQPIEALIIDSRSTAISPTGRVARVTPAADGDRRIFTVYLPPSLAKLRRGEPITILCHPTRMKTAVAAAWYE